DIALSLPVALSPNAHTSDDFYDQSVKRAEAAFSQASALWSNNLSLNGYPSAQAGKKALYQAMADIYFKASQFVVRPSGDLKGIDSRLGQAVDYLGKSVTVLKEIGDPNGTLYGRLKDQLIQAREVWKKVQTSDKAKKIQLYQQASKLFFGGAVQWLSDYSSAQANFLIGEVHYESASKTVEKWDSDNKVAVDNWLVQWNSVEISNTSNLQDLVKLFSGWANVCSNALADYTQALDAFDQLNDTLMAYLTTEQSRAVALSVKQLSDIQKLLGILNNAAKAWADAANLAIANPEDEGRLSQAQISIAQALALFNQADLQSSLMESKLFLSLKTAQQGKQKSFSILAQQAWVYTSRRLAQLLEQQVTLDPMKKGLIYRYYLQAFSYRNSVPPKIAADIQSHLEKVDLKAQAQQAIAYAHQQTNWSQEGTSSYTSKAYQAWHTALTASFAAYSLWKTSQGKLFNGARELYVQALQEASRLFSRNIPSAYDPGLISALLGYRLYLLYGLENNNAGQAEALVSMIKDPLQSYFKDGMNFLAVAQSQAQGYDKQIKAQQNLIGWVGRYNSLLEEQQNIINDYESFYDPGLSVELFLTKPILNGSNTTYSTQLLSPSVSIVIASPETETAHLYELKGNEARTQAQAASGKEDYVLSQKKHEEAKDAYHQALTIYNQLGMQDKAQNLALTYQQESILSYADALYRSIVPIGSDESLFNVTVYARYLLSPYTQQLPEHFEKPPALEQLLAAIKKPSTTQEWCSLLSEHKDLENNLILFAMALYLYSALTANNLTNALSGSDYYTVLTGATTADKFTDQTVKDYISSAQDYGEKLQDLVYNGITYKGKNYKSCLFPYEKDQKESFITLNKPMTAIPEVLGNAWDPTALSYYTLAQQTYQKGDDTDSVQKMEHKRAVSYLSHAYSLLLKVDFMLDKQIDPELLSLIDDPQERDILQKTKKALSEKSTEITDTLKQAMETFDDYYAVVLSDLFQVSAVVMPEITQHIGKFAYNGGDILRSFLRGDPSSDTYQNYLAKSDSMYMMAYGAYAQTKLSDQVIKTAQQNSALWKEAAESFIERKQYLRALGYLKKAQQPYANLVSDGYLTQALAQQALEPLLNIFTETIFKNGTNSLIDYMASNNPSGDSQDVAKSLQERSKLADALMFYGAIPTTAQTLYYDKSKETELVKTATDQIQAYVVSYLQEKGNTVSGDSSLEKMLSDLLLELPIKELESFISTAYATFAANLEVKDKHDSGIAAIIVWSNKLFSTLSTLYIQRYLAGEMPEQQFIDLMNAIKFANNDLLFPPDQVVGSWQGSQ
ncbi:MAG TPA: hypothetical protein VHA52_10405, partial [Candidatus Babeliaceae bacterium]|nr:hypothetical protein [Candidatus Babeliaceae bacterium]